MISRGKTGASWKSRLRLATFLLVLATNGYLAFGLIDRPLPEAAGPHEAGFHLSPTPLEMDAEPPSKKEKENGTALPQGEEQGEPEKTGLERPETLAIPPGFFKRYVDSVPVATGDPPRLTQEFITLLGLDDATVARINRAYDELRQEAVARDLAAMRVVTGNGRPQLTVVNADNTGWLAKANHLIGELNADPETRELFIYSFIGPGSPIRTNQRIQAGIYTVEERGKELIFTFIDTGATSRTHFSGRVWTGEEFILTPSKTRTVEPTNGRGDQFRLPLDDEIAAHIASEWRQATRN